MTIRPESWPHPPDDMKWPEEQDKDAFAVSPSANLLGDMKSLRVILAVIMSLLIAGVAGVWAIAWMLLRAFTNLSGG